MDTLKRSRIPTRVFLNQQKLSKGTEKENVEVTRVKCIKKTIRTRSYTTTQKILEVPIQRGRILSDSDSLQPEKKVKFSLNRPTVGGPSAGARAPLTDLNENATALQQGVLKRSKNSEKVRETELRQIIHNKFSSETTTYESRYSSFDCRTTSSSLNNGDSIKNDSEGILQQPSVKAFPVDRQKITVRRNLTPHPQAHIVNEDNSDLDEIFVDDTLHHINFKSSETPRQNLNKRKPSGLFVVGKLMSPIRPNIYTARTTVVVQGIPHEVKQPAKKKSLARKLQPAAIREVNVNTFYSNIDSTEYLEVIVNYQLKNDWKFVIEKNILKVYNPCLEARVAVVNWLMQAQDYLGQPPVILFTTIRMFDNVLASMSVPRNMYQLVGFVIMWIISKFEDTVNTLTAPKMVALCKDAYSVRQFLRMEKKLLAFFGFHLHIPDLTLYVTFYIKKLNNENALFLNSVYYILECYTLNADFSTVIPSVQAAAAVCLTLNIFHPFTNEWYKLKNTLGYYGKEELGDIMQDMLVHIHKVQDPSYTYRQTYQKYATKEKAQASIVLLGKLVAS